MTALSHNWDARCESVRLYEGRYARYWFSDETGVPVKPIF